MTELLSLLVCPDCKRSFTTTEDASLRCPACGRTVPLLDGKPLFTPVPETAHVYQRVERGPDQGTSWRRANWRFLESQVQYLDPDALLLDVGAGHGDFARAYAGRRSISLDVVPYPEVDLACDLAQCVPFRQASFDAIILMNVLEHVYDFHGLLDALFGLLKPGGSLLLAVPFMIKIHQAPFDFQRYTHYSLEQMARQHGFEVALLEGYYDPIFFLGEGTRNFRYWVLPKLSRPARWLGRGVLVLIEALIAPLKLLVGDGYVKSPESAKNPAAIGYHLVLKRPRA
jgi:SAM-dependent methyltransferase